MPGGAYNQNSGGEGIVYVSSLPATCTPGVTPAVQLSVAPYTIYYCSSLNTWTAVGAVNPAGEKVVFDGDSRTAGSGSTAQCGVSPCTIAAGGYTATTTGTATFGSTTLTVASGTGTANGQGVFGIGIAPQTTIASGGGTTTITLTTATISAMAGTTVKFGNMDFPSQAMRLPQLAGMTGYNLGVSGQTCGQIAARYATDAHTLSPAVTGTPGFFALNCGTNAEVAVTPTGTGTSTQTNIVVSSVTGIELGDAVTGTGIGSNAVVANSWNGTTTVPLTVANSGTVSGTITFTPSAASIAGAEAYLWGLAKADGYTAIATTNPMHIATSATRNLNDAYNNLVRGSQGLWDRLMDVHAFLVDTYDPNYFASDATHFTNQGYQVWAQQVAAAISLPFGWNAMAERRFANIGTGSGNTRGNDTCAYALTLGASNTCFGYGSFPVLTTGNFNSAFGDNDGILLVGGSANLLIGHGLGNSLISGGSNVLVGGDTNSDISFATSVGIGCSVTGNSGICLGHNATAAGSAFALGGGATASASGAIELDPVGGGTNSTANSLQFQSINFLNSSGIMTPTAEVPTPILVASLPGAAAGNAGQWRTVSNSTTVTLEGQTCVGGGAVQAAALSNGSVWKCF